VKAAPRIVRVHPDVTLGFIPSVAVTVWRKTVTLPHLDVFARELRAFIPDCRGRGYASITVIEPTISLNMPEDVRRRSEALQRELAPHIKCMAYVVESDGFVAATARTIASGFLLITRASYPLKLFATGAECATWAGRHVDVDEHEVLALIRSVRTG